MPTNKLDNSLYASFGGQREQSPGKIETPMGMSEGRGSVARFDTSSARPSAVGGSGESPDAVNSNDISILNYTMDEFIQSQLEDLEKIGTSGELFQEVWHEYRKQGKSLQ